MKVGIITVSDKGAKGEREDLSGRAIRALVKADSYEYCIVPDEKEEISKAIVDFVDNKSCNLVLTTGGTGLSCRDVTPEAANDVLDRQTPGISEVIRIESFKINKRAILSRALSGTRGKSLIINLPGSPKAVKECLEIILFVIPHALEILEKGSVECGSLNV